jgi:HSP20 family molecular chaperone IbpA
MRTLFYPHAIFDDMVSELFGSIDKKQPGGKYPLTNIYEEDNKTYMEIALAGFSKEDISISVENDILTIKGETLEEENPNRVYHKRDIAARSFLKSYNLLTPLDTIKAEFNDGILKLELIPNKNKKEIKVKID